MTLGNVSAEDLSWKWKLRNQLSRYSDGFFPAAEQLARKAADLDTSQIRKLQAVAYCAVKFSDLIDYIKIQTGRRPKWSASGFGANLLEVLAGFPQKAQGIVDQLGLEGDLADEIKMQVQLTLCREFVKHVAAHYQYSNPGWDRGSRQ